MAFALELLREIVEPALGLLEGLLDPGQSFDVCLLRTSIHYVADLTRNLIWRNDFCR